MVPVKIFLIGLVSLVHDYSTGLWIVAPNATKHHHMPVVAWQTAPEANANSFAVLPLGGFKVTIAGLEAGGVTGLPTRPDQWTCGTDAKYAFPKTMAEAKSTRWLVRPGCFDAGLAKVDAAYLTGSDLTMVSGRLDLSRVKATVEVASIADYKGEMAAFTFSKAGYGGDIRGLQAVADVVTVAAAATQASALKLQFSVLGSAQPFMEVPVPVVNGEARILFGNVPTDPDCAALDAQCVQRTDHHFRMLQNLNSSGSTRIQAGGVLSAGGTNIDPVHDDELVRLEEGPPSVGGAHRPICMITFFEK